MSQLPPKTPPHALLIAVLLAQIAYGLLAMAICLPSMQEWSSIFGSSQANVQLTLSAFVLAQGAMQLVYGPLADRFGRRSDRSDGTAMDQDRDQQL